MKTLDGPRTDVADITTYACYTSDDPGGAYRSGDRWMITNALGHVTEFLSYDAHGRALSIKDPNNAVTTLTYHPRGWLTSRTLAGRTTTFSYDNAGELERVTRPNGAFLDYTYDEAQRLIEVQDQLGNRIDYSLDAMGNTTREDVFDPNTVLARTRSQVYDSLNRLDQLIGAHGQQIDYGYDANDNLDTQTDAQNRLTDHDYDALDRLIRITDPKLGETDYQYDSRDNLTQVTDPNSNDTLYGYDGWDNLISIDSPDTGLTTNTYDSAGNRLTQTDARGVTVTHSYDALNRLKICYLISIIDCP